ncbi:unnamed protein product [Urochloa decumbens]|uniref:F-box domain-containing protein n=1 Tax=Urochloa decumbens TaxID=240449 RepID=A0ABC9H940_9POAL
MPDRRLRNKAPVECGGDPFCTLPDAVVEHIVAFLPALDAVRTSVLARRWRPLSRSAPRLRIANIEAPLRHVSRLNRFVRQVLLLREPGATLDECEIDLRGFPQLNGTCVDLWIRHGSMCRVQVLQVRFYAEERFELADWPLFSQSLVRLELHGLALEESFLDFSSCPALEDLKINNCLLAADKILSRSLKHLKIIGCELCWQFIPTHISAQGLITLQLDDYVGVTPILESMLSLEKASIKLGQNNEGYCDFCDNGGSGECTCDMCLVYYNANGSRTSVSFLLGGLSSATYLELKASSEMVTFKRDLRCCPAFINLKTLLLDDWCLVADLHMLLCFLQQTPILEKLILQLCKEPKPAVEMEGGNLMEQSLTLRQLKIVEVKCPIVNERVQNFMKILRASSSCLNQVIVQEI